MLGSMNDGEVLVTGANGFIGRWLLCELTGRGRSVVAMVRRAAEREAELRSFVSAHGGDARLLRVVEGEIERPGLGLTAPLTGVRAVYHLAARFEFGASVEQARAANVQGLLEVARWASEQPSLQRFVLLGGYRMTRPEPAMRAFERPISERARAAIYRGRGAYEVSKHEGYWAFRRFADERGLRWTAVHPSTVIGDSRTGETTQRTGLAATVAMLHRGRMPAMVGGAKTFVPVVTVDHLARVLATVIDNERTVGQDLTVLDQRTPMLPELVAMLAQHCGVRAPRISLPVSLVAALPQWLSGIDRESLAFITDDRYDTSEADEHARAMGIEHPPLEPSVERWCRYLLAQRFLSA
jgi:dihydroflavonol-4-reductase